MNLFSLTKITDKNKKLFNQPKQLSHWSNLAVASQDNKRIYCTPSQSLCQFPKTCQKLLLVKITARKWIISYLINEWPRFLEQWTNTNILNISSDTWKWVSTAVGQTSSSTFSLWHRILSHPSRHQHSEHSPAIIKRSSTSEQPWIYIELSVFIAFHELRSNCS